MDDDRMQETLRCRVHVSQPPNAIERSWAIDGLIDYINRHTNPGVRICCVIQSIPKDWVKLIAREFSIEKEFFQYHFRPEPDLANIHPWLYPSRSEDYQLWRTLDGFDTAAEHRTMRISYYRVNKWFCKLRNFS